MNCTANEAPSPNQSPESEMILKRLKELNTALYEASLKVNRHKKRLFGEIMVPSDTGPCEKSKEPSGFIEQFYFETRATANILDDLFKDLQVIERW